MCQIYILQNIMVCVYSIFFAIQCQKQCKAQPVVYVSLLWPNTTEHLSFLPFLLNPLFAVNMSPQINDCLTLELSKLCISSLKNLPNNKTVRQGD